MHSILVIRQVAAVLDAHWRGITRSFGLTPQDALVLAWLSQQPGIPGSELGCRVGRARQSMQRTLDRLEQSRLVERRSSMVHGCTVGWALSARGDELWGRLARFLASEDAALERLRISPRELVKVLCQLMEEVLRLDKCPWGELVIPPASSSTPSWDL